VSKRKRTPKQVLLPSGNAFCMHALLRGTNNLLVLILQQVAGDSLLHYNLVTHIPCYKYLLQLHWTNSTNTTPHLPSNLSCRYYMYIHDVGVHQLWLRCNVYRLQFKFHDSLFSLEYTQSASVGFTYMYRELLIDYRQLKTMCLYRERDSSVVGYHSSLPSQKCVTDQ
jgi:hypothetical protein